MSYEFFTESYRDVEPKISITHQGTFGFNSAFCCCSSIDFTKTPFGLVGYDKETNTIAIKLLEKWESGANKFHMYCNSATLSAIRFFRYFKLNHEETKKYSPQIEDLMIIIKLNESVIEVLTEAEEKDNG